MSIPLSIVLARFVALNQGTLSGQFGPEFFNIIVRNFVINFIIIFSLVFVLVSIISAVEPISLFNNDYKKLYKRIRRVVIMLLPIIILSVVAYSILNGQDTLIMSLFVIILISILLLIIINVLFFIFTRVFNFNETTRYTNKSLKNKKGVQVVSIFNITLILLFLLIGFVFPSNLQQMVNNKFVDELPYNYIIHTNDIEDLILSMDKELSEESKYGVMSSNQAMLATDEDNVVEVNDIGVNKNFDIDFKILEGEGFENLDSESIIVSESLSNSNDIDIGQEIIIGNSNKPFKLEVIGIYDNVGLNSDLVFRILLEDEELTTAMIKTEDQLDKLDISNSTIIDISQVGDSIYQNANNFLKGFKYICIVLSGSSLLFSILISISSMELKQTEYTILIALNKGISFIKKNLLVEFVLSVFLTTLSSCLLYYLISKIIFNLFLSIQTSFNFKIIPAVLLASLLANIIVYSYKFFTVDRIIDYKVLRSE